MHGPNPLKLMSRNPAVRNRAPASWYQSELSRMMMVCGAARAIDQFLMGYSDLPAPGVTLGLATAAV